MVRETARFERFMLDSGYAMLKDRSLCVSASWCLCVDSASLGSVRCQALDAPSPPRPQNRGGLLSWGGLGEPMSPLHTPCLPDRPTVHQPRFPVKRRQPSRKRKRSGDRSETGFLGISQAKWPPPGRLLIGKSGPLGEKTRFLCPGRNIEDRLRTLPLIKGELENNILPLPTLVRRLGRTTPHCVSASWRLCVDRGSA